MVSHILGEKWEVGSGKWEFILCFQEYSEGYTGAKHLCDNTEYSSGSNKH